MAAADCVLSGPIVKTFKLSLLRSSLLWGLFATTSCLAAELIPRIANQQLSAVLTGLALPGSLAKDFSSGLENKILIRVSIPSQLERLGRVDVSIIVKYDLWDEVFGVRTFSAAAMTRETRFKQVQDVMSYLASIDLTDLFPFASMPQDQDMVLQADILINPVEREKIERLSKWVAANSTPRGTAGLGPDTATLTSKPNDLFNRIFEQYANGADIAAPWRLTITSKSFTLRRLSLGVRNP